MGGVLSLFKIYGIKKILLYSFFEIKRKVMREWVLGSYSQLGEDTVIDRLLENKKDGFFVDVGAYDPNRFSNTKRFYKKGWRGINIEPDTVNFEKFLHLRPKDINLNIGVGPKEGTLLFYEMMPKTLSTFSEKDAGGYQKKGFKLVRKIKVPVQKLSSVLEKHSCGRVLDFLSVDTEGYDLEVLKSGDWKEYHPRVICVESSNPSSKISDDKIEKFLVKRGYKKYLDNGINAIYVKKN